MSTAPRYLPRYTVADYRQWEGDWELIDGIPIAMTPSPFGPHERVVSRLARQLGNAVAAGEDCEVYTNFDWIVAPETVVRPDIMLVRGDQPDRHLEIPPTVMVEVLSPSTRQQDLTVKRSLARDQEVPHYLIVDVNARTVRHISDETDRSYIESDSLTLDLGEGLAIIIKVSALFDRR